MFFCALNHDARKEVSKICFTEWIAEFLLGIQISVYRQMP